MAKCVECLYLGDKGKSKDGNAMVFCLVRGHWTKEDAKCDLFRESADLSLEIRNQLAAEIRQERSENRRLGKNISKKPQNRNSSLNPILRPFHSRSKIFRKIYFLITF